MYVDTHTDNIIAAEEAAAWENFEDLLNSF